MGVAGVIFPSLSVRASDRQQQSKIDATLRLVERALSAHRTLRTEIRKGRARVDAMVEGALGVDPRHEQTSPGPEHET